MVALSSCKIRFLSGRQVQLASSAIAEEDKDIDCSWLSFSLPGLKHWVMVRAEQKTVYFCNPESALHRLHLSHTGAFPSKKQGYPLKKKK